MLRPTFVCGPNDPAKRDFFWIERILDKIVEGRGTLEELNLVHEIASNVTGNTICAFGDGAAMPALSFVRKFRKQFEARVVDTAAQDTQGLSA